NARGMSARFGKTDLRIWSMADTTMVTFARPRGANTIEHSVSFVGSWSDPKTNFGMQSCHTDVMTALNMINDVIKGWPENVDVQRHLLKADKNVKLDVVAALEAAEKKK